MGPRWRRTSRGSSRPTRVTWPSTRLPEVFPVLRHVIDRRRKPGRFLLLVLVALAACGGGSDPAIDAPLVGDEVYEIEPPQDVRDVVIAVKPDGSAKMLRGLSEKDRAAGRRHPSRTTSPWAARLARVEAYAGAAWSRLQPYMRIAAGRESTRVELRVHGANTPSRTLTFFTGKGSRPYGGERQTLCAAFVVEGDALRLRVAASDGPWLTRHGCGADRALDWPWDGGDALVPFRTLIVEARAACGEALHVRVEAPGLRQPWATPRADPAAMPTIAQMEAVLRVLVEAGITHVDLGQIVHDRPYGAVEQRLDWLAAHQSPDGRWDSDGFLDWCYGQRMARPETSDGQSHYDTGATASALLVFMGTGYTHRGKTLFAKNVKRGLRWLRERQRDDGTFDAPGTRDRGLTHALAAATLAQIVQRTDATAYRDPSARALAALPEAWRPAAHDPLATVWAALAVHAAGDNAVGAQFRDELREACDRHARGDTLLGVTAGTLGVVLLGGDADPAELAVVLRRAEAEDLSTLDPRLAHLVALVAMRAGKAERKAWYAAMKSVATQWGGGRPLDQRCCLAGSHARPPEHDLPGGRLEATTAWTLTAEIYYRYDDTIGLK